MRWKQLAAVSMMALTIGACSPAEDATSVPAAAYDAATSEQLKTNALLAGMDRSQWRRARVRQDGPRPVEAGA